MSSIHTEEALNVSNYDIPAFGVVEIIDTIFPDHLNKYARPVFVITRPRADSCPHTAIAMDVVIAAGAYGEITFEGPTYALYKYTAVEADQPRTGDIWGSEKDLFTLKKGNRGYMVLGGAANIGATAQVRVTLQPAITSGVHKFYNSSTETMPAYGVGRITAYDAANAFHTITKPDTTFGRLYMINGASDVLTGRYGYGFFFEETDVLYDTGITPTAGECWGPKNGQWTLAKNYYGFTICGGEISGRVRCLQHFVNQVVGKTSGAFTKGSSGTLLVYAGVLGSEVTTGCSIGVYDRFAALATGKSAQATWIGGGWDLVAGEC